MAFEFKRLADVEALSEVPENATVLAEVNGAIKRVPGNGLGGSGNIIVLVQDANSDSVSPMIAQSFDTYTANMDFADAMAAFRAHEITGAVVYQPQNSVSPKTLDSDSPSGSFEMLSYAFVSDASYDFGMDCLVFTTLESYTSIFWTINGISTEQPYIDGGDE